MWRRARRIAHLGWHELLSRSHGRTSVATLRPGSYGLGTTAWELRHVRPGRRPLELLVGLAVPARQVVPRQQRPLGALPLLVECALAVLEVDVVRRLRDLLTLHDHVMLGEAPLVRR